MNERSNPLDQPLFQAILDAYAAGRTVGDMLADAQRQLDAERARQAVLAVEAVEPGRAARAHLFSFGDAEVAAELGVQVRAWCGVWAWPGRPGESTLVAEKGLPANLCRNCQRIYRARVSARLPR